jgi:hypothetical protein
MNRRNVADIISDAETLADHFEQWEPSSTGPVDGAPIKAVHDAPQYAAAAQNDLADAVGPLASRVLVVVHRLGDGRERRSSPLRTQGLQRLDVVDKRLG